MSSAASYPALAGNLGSVCTGGIVTTVLTFLKPDNTFNWESTRALNNADHFISDVATAVARPVAATLDEKRGKDSSDENLETEAIVVKESEYDLRKGAAFV